MEANYAILLALCVVVVSDAKVFIGSCDYGFCEQNCKQIKEFEMECFCKRGFTLKTDGRKCLKTFITDDEFSGDAASGDNCDNEDGNCDKTVEVGGGEGGIETVISGDGEDGSGDFISSIVQVLRPEKSSSLVAEVSSSSIATTMTTTSKTSVYKTIDVSSSVGFTTTPYLDILQTTQMIERIPTKTKSVTQKMSSSIIGQVDVLTTSSEVLLKKSILPSLVLTSIPVSVSSSLPLLSFSTTFDEKVIDGTPQPLTSLTQGEESTSIYAIPSEKISLSSSTSSLTSVTPFQKRTDSKPDGLMSTIYKRIQEVYQQETIQHEGLFTTTSTKTHMLYSTSVIPLPTMDPRIIVIQSDDHDIMPDPPMEYIPSKSDDVVEGDIFPDVTLALPHDTSSKVIHASDKKDEGTKERDILLITPNIHVQKKVMKSVLPVIPIGIDRIMKSSKDSKSSTLNRLPFHRTKLYKINATARTFPKKSVHKLKGTIQKSVTTMKPQTSFISISVSSEIIKKTTPLLDVYKIHTLTSTYQGFPIREPSSSVTEKVISKTDIDTDDRDLISGSSTKSSSLFILQKKATEVKDDKMSSSSKILPTSSSTKVLSTTSSVTTTPKTTTRTPKSTTKEIKPIVVNMDKSESHAHTVLVNTYLLTFGMCFTICFLVVY